MKGLTLIEVILGIFLFSLVLLVIIGMQRFVGETYNFSFDEMQAVEQNRAGVDLLTKEIRQASPAEDGSYPLIKADNQEFAFYADIDEDNQVEKIRYYLSGSDLQKSVTQPTDTVPADYPAGNESVQTVASYIRNAGDPIFYYYNGNWPLEESGNPLDTPTRLKDTKYMRIFLRVNLRPEKIPNDFELSSGIQLRNLKTNL